VALDWQALLHRPGAVGPVRTAGPAVCVVDGSDQGICGQFNEAVLNHALSDGGPGRILLLGDDTRQVLITAELLGILAGFEALEASEG
jgi:F0F1-type ATP synthase gamma subunit